MRKRYNHATSVEQYRIRNRFSYKTNITAATQISLDASKQVLPNDDCYDFDDNENEVDSNDDDDNNNKNDENDENEVDGDDNKEEDDDYENEADGNDDDEGDDDENDEELVFDNENEYENENEDENEDNDDYNNYDNNEGDEEDDDEGEDEEVEDNDPIVDASIDRDQMPNTNGSFAPYFENTTSALLFCWIQKHNICKLNKYDNFIMIIY